jgi:hypothetical protein
MSDKPEGEAHNPDPGPPAYSQEFQQAHVGARGVFSTGALVIQGPSEFVLDFVLRMNQPQQIVARVVIPLALLPRLIGALRDNVEKYKQTFGAPPGLPTAPAPSQPPTIEEIYSQLKLPEELQSGVYANQVMVVHSPAEFCFEFITTFYPKAAVSTRVFLSVPHVPVLLNTFVQAWQNYQAKFPPPK